MRILLLLALLAPIACTRGPLHTGTGAGPEASDAPPATAQADGCQDPALQQDPPCTGPLCGRAERVKLTCELRDALDQRYVFFHLKEKLLSAAGRPPFDARAHLDACVAAERAVVREDEPLRFMDRFRRCVAAFEDGHLFPAMPRSMPAVALGVALRLAADGKVYVAYRDPGVARWLEEASARTPAQRLEIGDEVVAVDGRPVREVIDDLAGHISGSSVGARVERAVDALTRRDFAYPERREAVLTVAAGGARRAVSLPWFVAGGAAQNPLLAGWLKRTGIGSSDRIDWRSPSRGAWYREGGVTEGLVRGDPVVDPVDAAGLAVYRADGGQLAVRLGEAKADGAPVCYAQILSFHSENLTGPGGKEPYLDVLRDFLAGCAERGRDLVLDLRQNEGGYLSHSSALAAMLTPKETITPGGALLLRATAQNEKVYKERSPMLGASTDQEPGHVPSEPEQILMAIRDARRAKAEYTPAFLEAPISADEELGFRGRVVALTAPGCMSACDRLADILKHGHRAVLVGGPTEGAGASQQETKDQSARWTDHDGWVGVSIPNAAMGVQVNATAGATQASAAVFFEQFAFENRPVEPDVAYATTRDDLLHQNRGWLAAARAALQHAERPAAPERTNPPR